MVIDGVPCRVVEMEISAPGKHGHAKVRMTAVGIFDNTKKILLKPVDADVEVPDIRKKRAQVVSISGETVQLMDLDTYDMYDAQMGEFKDSIKTGMEVEVVECMGRIGITRVLGNK